MFRFLFGAFSLCRKFFFFKKKVFFKKSKPFRNRGWDSRFQLLFLSFSSTQKITNYKFNLLVFRFSADFRSFTSFKKLNSFWSTL